MTSSKRIGNGFENKISKILGKWWFNDEHMLIRSITSGAKKEIEITGDIVPQKQFPKDSILKKWNIHIECKTGYKNLSTFNSKIKFMKSITKNIIENDLRDEHTNILVIIADGKSILFCTEVLIDSEMLCSYWVDQKLFNVFDLKLLVEKDPKTFLKKLRL